MNCDDVALFLIASDAPTLSTQQEAELHNHVADCPTCRQLTAEAGDDARYRWVVRIPDDALDDPDLLVLPTVDPIVFAPDAELARGGMGRIVRARDRRLGRDVAIKEVLSPGLRARFEREVAITAKLQHPAIVPVYEAGAWPDGSAFYTMRLVPGGTLAEAIAKAPQRLALLPHVIAATEALAYAHARRIVHRDLKPGNILVGEYGETVVIDWGLAKELDRRIGEDTTASDPAAPELTRVGSVMGTPGFMSPEQAAGDDVDERTDVYALGAILYNVLAGHPPYWDSRHDEQTRTPDRLVELARERSPTPLAALAPSVPTDLRAIVERAMARDPAARFATAKELAEELRRFESGQLLRSREYRMRELIARWVRRHRTAVAVGAIALVVVAIVAAMAIVNVARERTAAERAQGVAEAHLVTLLEEQGRDQLLRGDRDRALAYLAEVFARGRDTPALRHMLGAALRDFDLLDHATPAQPISALGFTDDGHLVTVGQDAPGELVTWNGDVRIATHAIGESVAEAVLTPDARRAIAVTRDRVGAYDVATGQRSWRVEDPTLNMANLVVDPAGKRVVIFADPTQDHAFAELRDVATGAVIARLPAPLPLCAAFSPDGTRVALGGRASLAVYAADTGAAVATWDTPREIDVVAFVAGDRLATATEEHPVLLWRIGERAPRELTGHAAIVSKIAVAPRGEAFATADITGYIRLWSPDGSLVHETRDHKGELGTLAFSPDGALLVAGGADRQLYVWDAHTFELMRALSSARDRRSDEVFALAWSRDGGRFATVRRGEHPVLVWRPPAGHRIARVRARASAVAGTAVVTATTAEVVLDGAAQALVQPLPEDARLRVQTGGNRALVQAGRTAIVYDVGRRAELSRPALVEETPDLRLSPDGRYVLELPAVSTDASRARVLDAATGRVVRELAAGQVTDGAFSPDGERLALAFDGTAEPRMWRVATGEQLPLPSVDIAPLHVRFDPTGRRLLFTAVDRARLIDAATGATIADLADPGTIDTIRFGGERFATWSVDHTVTLWSATGARIATFDGVAREAFALTGDGERLATGSDEGTVRIWDATGRLLEMVAEWSPVAGIAWTADGARLVVQADETATTWDAHLEQRSPAELAALARAGRWQLIGGALRER